MKRASIAPRKDWEQKVERVGLTFHHTTKAAGTVPYWDESGYYEFTASEVEELERATNALHEMCLAAAQHIIDRKLYSRLGIPESAIPIIEQAWEAEPPAIYGRFDFAYDGTSPPKMLEYNADTPTGLLEAAVVQWYWLEELFPKMDQFNSIHERLIAKWKELRQYLKGDGVLYLCHMDNVDTEDLMTTQYMFDTASQAGIVTRALLMEQIGWDTEARCFVDHDGLRMHNIFKLYPWEWLIPDDFGPHALETYSKMNWIEPIWKMLLSNKGILPVLWELYPEHPNLLPAYFDSPHGMTEYAAKPLTGREGQGVMLVRDGASIGEPNRTEAYIYQALNLLSNFDGNFPVVGSWVIDQESAGIGIRESTGLITDNLSRFVPHVFEPA